MCAGKLRPHRRGCRLSSRSLPFDESAHHDRRFDHRGAMNFGLGKDEALARAHKLMETVRLDPTRSTAIRTSSPAASASASVSPGRCHGA